MLDLIIKNGTCFIDGNLEKKDLGGPEGKISKIDQSIYPPGTAPSEKIVNDYGSVKYDKNGYPDKASPAQIGAMAEKFEEMRQMTGSDGRHDKPKPKKINEYADEMIYYISMLGVTGSALKNSPEDIQKKYMEIKKLCPNKRIVIGFGITKEVIKKLKNNVHGLVIGSQICTAIEKSIKNGQNSAALEASTKLYKSLLKEVN